LLNTSSGYQFIMQSFARSSVQNVSKTTSVLSSKTESFSKYARRVNSGKSSVRSYSNQKSSSITSFNANYAVSKTTLSYSHNNSAATRSFASTPDSSPIGLPALSPSMEKGNIVKWRKKEGDKLSPGDIIAEIETDKATVDFEVTDSGYLAKILFPEGSKDITVGETIALMVEKQADVAAFKNYKADAAPKKEEAKKEEPKKEEVKEQKKEEPKEQPKKQSQPQEAQQSKPAKPQSNQMDISSVVPGAPPPRSNATPRSGVYASPLAKNVAAETGVDLSSVKGSGPNQRIVKADVLQAQQQAQQHQQKQPAGSPVSVPGAAFTEIPNSQIRKVTAQRLTQSKQTIPHYYLSVECRVDELMSLRQKLNDGSKGSFKLSVNDFVVKAASLALRKVPACNSSWSDEAIRRYNTVDINVAVNTEKGLFTPLIKNADQIGLVSINSQVRELAEKAKANKITPNEMASGTFTISNLGMFGISHFSAVINPPQACILAVGGTEKKVVLNEKSIDKTDQFKVSNVMNVTLSCDHRVVDGAIGAEWLKSFKEYIEDPTRMLL